MKSAYSEKSWPELKRIRSSHRITLASSGSLALAASASAIGHLSSSTAMKAD
jgi:hypothetical protein